MKEKKMMDIMDIVKFRNLLTAFFKKMRKEGYFARQRWECCLSCGMAAMPKDIKKYIFYHEQDRPGVLTGEIYIAWKGDGKFIVSEAKKAGLKTEWNGTKNHRILLRYK